ncbi:MAG TPA: DUF1877 family protein [Gemmatimonadaceae bacterium]|jgi:hypothetical protein|nr:DUF1877 family protein [Gemmatimonadaceae bacterium]
MPTICRLIQLSPDEAASLVANPATLTTRVGAATIYSDVYRYWHAIEYLLAAHRPDGTAAKWLAAGATVLAATGDVPSARVLSPAQVQDLDAELRHIQPDDLFAHYDASALDAAQIYPGTWQAWEEDFDPLGQVLEHYFFLQQFTAKCATAHAALLLYFDVLAEGTV